MKQVFAAGIFTFFGILFFVSGSESLPFYDGLSSALKSLQRFFSAKNSDAEDSLIPDDSNEDGMDVSEHGRRVKRSTRSKPFWKRFFIKFWKAVLRVSHPHFYQSWRPVPFVPIRPTARTPPPTTPDPNEQVPGGGHHYTDHPTGVPAPGGSSAPHPQPTHTPMKAAGSPPPEAPVNPPPPASVNPPPPGSVNPPPPASANPPPPASVNPPPPGSVNPPPPASVEPPPPASVEPPPPASVEPPPPAPPNPPPPPPSQ